MRLYDKTRRFEDTLPLVYKCIGSYPCISILIILFFPPFVPLSFSLPFSPSLSLALSLSHSLTLSPSLSLFLLTVQLYHAQYNELRNMCVHARINMYVCVRVGLRVRICVRVRVYVIRIQVVRDDSLVMRIESSR